MTLRQTTEAEAISDLATGEQHTGHTVPTLANVEENRKEKEISTLLKQRK